MFNHVELFVEQLDQLGNFSDVFLSANLNECMVTHDRTVMVEKNRKESVQRAIKEAGKDKLEEKQRKKEAKESNKKAAELKRLKDDVDSLFIARGEYRDSILQQEVSNVNSHH